MKTALPLLVALLALLAACAATAADFTQGEAEKYLAMAHEEETLEGQLAAPGLSAVEREKLATRQTELEDAMDTLERAVETRKNSGLIGAIGGLLGPGGEILAGALGMGLAPLLGPRGRRHAVNLIKSAAPGTGRPAKNLAGDLARYIGAVHTEPGVTITGAG
jgi:hypothetical protein